MPGVGPARPRRLDAPRTDFRWLMMSNVCKHCTHAACLDVCPTGALFRTEFGTVVVQEDICNGCGYCIPACPYGVIDQRKDDGRAWKCTLCYDRIGDGLTPGLRQGLPDRVHPVRRAGRAARARRSTGWRSCTSRASTEARLYGHDPDDGVGGDGAFFLLLDEPEVYGLPPDPVVTTRDLPAMWKRAGLAALAMAAAAVVPRSLARSRGARRSSPPAAARQRPADERGGPRAAGRGGEAAATGRWCRRPSSAPTTAGRSSRPPVWHHDIAAYLFTGGLAAGSALLAAGGDATGRPGAAPRRPGDRARRGRAPARYFLVNDLGRPERFHHMLRVAKPTSPMSMGTWILSAFGAAAGVAAVAEAAPLLPGPGRARAGPRAAAAGRHGRPVRRRGGRARPWPRTRRCCSPTPPRRAGTRRTRNCRSSSPAARWPAAPAWA